MLMLMLMYELDNVACGSTRRREGSQLAATCYYISVWSSPRSPITTSTATTKQKKRTALARLVGRLRKRSTICLREIICVDLAVAWRRRVNAEGGKSGRDWAWTGVGLDWCTQTLGQTAKHGGDHTGGKELRQRRNTTQYGAVCERRIMNAN